MLGLARRLAPSTILLFALAPALAETFPVSTAEAFQTALTTAEDNGEDDLVQVAAGNYVPAATLTYVAAENHALTIQGAGVGLTTLQGSDLRQVLSLSSGGSAADLTVADLTLSHGLASGADGGALHLETVGAALSLTDCEVLDSAVTGSEDVGGGATLVSDSGNITVDGCAFRRNTSDANVGGLYVATVTGSIELLDSVFDSNGVDNTGGPSNFGDGGGAMIYADGVGTAHVSGSTFQGNTAQGGDNPDAGGLMIYLLGATSTATVEGSTFTQNEADLGGGGLFMRLNAGGTLLCHDNDFQENIAHVGGGGGAFLYNETGSSQATANVFELNQAGEDGGGLWVYQGLGTATSTGNRFSANTASNNGGGLALVSETAAATTSFDVFEGNDAVGVGAGFSFATTGGSLALSSTTFYANTAGGDGGGLYLYFDAAGAGGGLVDSVFWQNGPNAYAFSSGSGGSMPPLRYSDVGGGMGQPFFGEGCIDEDPLFTDPLAGVFTLQWPAYPDPAGRSPCIDTGDPASPPDPDGSRADMGAFPYEQGGLVFQDGFESGSTGRWTLVVP